jgi:phosphate transport system substrate-binding protein
MQPTARRLTAITAVALLAAATSLAVSPPAAAYTPISGAGSTWSANAINAWKANVSQYGMVVNYAPVGSTIGRNEFKQGTVAWAGSDIPYGVRDGNYFDPPPDPSTQRGFAYMPDTAGGTVFMYNLKIGLRRVTNLRLSGDTIAKIFTGVIKNWNDPAIAADNPGLTLPATPVVPVVRSDGSGSTAQFTQWMVAREHSYWSAYCGKVGRNPCTQTSAYPVPSGSAIVGQPGDLGVAGYVAQQQSVGAIGYVEYSYAINAGFPVAKMLNSAGYYTEPTPGHVAVALLKAKINNDRSDPNVYLTQDLSQVYTNPDRRTYPLSSYSYMILPTDSNFGVTPAKGATLGDFGKYLLCQGQNQVDALGYSALPINLVQAGFDQLRKIPGANVPNINIRTCNNPTFSTNGTNTLATTDPYPSACDKKGPSQCVAGTGGAKNQVTPVNPSAQAGNPTGGSNNLGGSGGNGGSGGSGPNNSGPGGNASSGPGGTGPGGSTGAVSGPGAVVNGPAGSSSNAAAAAQQAGCDPDTGCPGTTGASANGALDPLPNPTSASASLGDGLRVTLMALAGALLLGLGLGPPLIAHASARRRQRQAGGAP